MIFDFCGGCAIINIRGIYGTQMPEKTEYAVLQGSSVIRRNSYPLTDVGR